MKAIAAEQLLCEMSLSQNAPHRHLNQREGSASASRAPAGPRASRQGRGASSPGRGRCPSREHCRSTAGRTGWAGRWWWRRRSSARAMVRTSVSAGSGDAAGGTKGTGDLERLGTAHRGVPGGDRWLTARGHPDRAHRVGGRKDDSSPPTSDRAARQRRASGSRATLPQAAVCTGSRTTTAVSVGRRAA